jgi:hypothetical protein
VAVLIHEVPAPINGVIFDFHATLVDGGDPERSPCVPASNRT